MKRFIIGLFLALLFVVPSGSFAAPFVKSDIQSPTLIRQVPTLAELQAIPVTSTTVSQVHVTGRLAEGDGYEGTFYPLSGDQSANAGVLVDTLQGVFVKPATPGDGSTGVWVRAYQGAVSVLWFGADLTDSLDDRPATNVALNWLEYVGSGSIGVLEIPEGTLSVTGSILQPSNTIIRGAGIGKTLIIRIADAPTDGGVIGNKNMYADPVTFTGTNFATAHLYGLNNNITIENLTIDGASIAHPTWNSFGVAWVGTDRATLQNVKVTNTGQQGIRGTGTKGSQILSSQFVDNLLNGIHLEDSIDYLIENNEVTGSGDYGIEVTSGVLIANALISTGDGSIRLNKVSDSATFGIAVRGLDILGTNPNLKPVDGAVIELNKVSSNPIGIVLNEWCTNIWISKNNVFDNTKGIGSAVSVGNTATYCHIVDNNVHDNADNGFDLINYNDGYIERNIVIRNPGHGVSISGVRDTISKNKILDNGAGGGQQGLLLVSTSDFIVTFNNIVNADTTFSIFENLVNERNVYFGNIINQGITPIASLAHFRFFGGPLASDADNQSKDVFTMYNCAGSAPPGTDYAEGAFCKNTTPAVGQPTGWIFATGAWRPKANL